MSEYFVKYRVGGWLIGNTRTKIIEAEDGEEAVEIAEKENNNENLFDWQYTFDILDIKKL